MLPEHRLTKIEEVTNLRKIMYETFVQSPNV